MASVLDIQRALKTRGYNLGSTGEAKDGVDEPGAPRSRTAIEDALPLFPDEKKIARALLGSGPETEWRAMAPLLERNGLIPVDALMGGRFWPAVVAFFFHRAASETTWRKLPARTNSGESAAWAARLPQAQPNAWPAAVIGNELDAGGFESAAKSFDCPRLGRH